MMKENADRRTQARKSNAEVSECEEERHDAENIRGSHIVDLEDDQGEYDHEDDEDSLPSNHKKTK